jgi:acyl-CoA dehydrogenase
LHAFLQNLPNRWAAVALRIFIFPRGRTYSAPADQLSQKVVELMTTTGEARERLSQQAYTTLEPGNPIGLLQEALELSEQVAPLEKRLRQAFKEGLISSEYLGDQIPEGKRAGVISKAEASDLESYHEKVKDLLAVDDFAPEELIRAEFKPDESTKVSKKAARKTPRKTTKKAARKKASSKKKTTRKKKN